MEKLISETLQIARERFAAFGFKETQIEQLLESGRQDLEEEISKLSQLIMAEEHDLQEINQSLHAIKGLLYNMGNMDAGDIMVDLRNTIENEESISKIKTLIGV
jgi:hypothetical protein